MSAKPKEGLRAYHESMSAEALDNPGRYTECMNGWPLAEFDGHCVHCSATDRDACHWPPMLPEPPR